MSYLNKPAFLIREATEVAKNVKGVGFLSFPRLKPGVNLMGQTGGYSNGTN